VLRYAGGCLGFNGPISLMDAPYTGVNNVNLEGPFSPIRSQPQLHRLQRKAKAAVVKIVYVSTSCVVCYTHHAFPTKSLNSGPQVVDFRILSTHASNFGATPGEFILLKAAMALRALR